MKKRKNNKAFALVETLICSVIVCAIFIVLIVNYYPLLGKLQRYQNYDNSEDKYIAYHLGELIKENSTIFDTEPQNNLVSTYDSDSLCSTFKLGTQEKCLEFFKQASISKAYYTNYSITNLKNSISNIESSRSFELYVKYMPSHEWTKSTKDADYKRIIIERCLNFEKDSEAVSSIDSDNKKVYRYANIEVKVK